MREEKRENSLKLISKKEIEMLRTYGLLKIVDDKSFLQSVSASLMSLKDAGATYINMELLTLEISRILNYYLEKNEKISKLNNEEKKKIIMTLSLATIQSLVDKGIVRLAYSGTEKIEVSASKKMESEVLKKMHKDIVKRFIDILILAEFRNTPMSGYDVIAYIHKKFGILVSSGTVYSLLYSLERDGLIEGTWTKRRRQYMLTQKGEKTIEAILKTGGKFERLMSQFVKLSP